MFWLLKSLNEVAETTKKLRVVAQEAEDLRSTQEEYTKILEQSSIPLKEAEEKANTTNREMKKGIRETLKASKSKVWFKKVNLAIGGERWGPFSVVVPKFIFGCCSGFGEVCCG